MEEENGRKCAAFETANGLDVKADYRDSATILGSIFTARRSRRPLFMASDMEKNLVHRPFDLASMQVLNSQHDGAPWTQLEKLRGSRPFETARNSQIPFQYSRQVPEHLSYNTPVCEFFDDPGAIQTADASQWRKREGPVMAQTRTEVLRQQNTLKGTENCGPQLDTLGDALEMANRSEAPAMSESKSRPPIDEPLREVLRNSPRKWQTERWLSTQKGEHGMVDLAASHECQQQEASTMISSPDRSETMGEPQMGNHGEAQGRHASGMEVTEVDSRGNLQGINGALQPVNHLVHPRSFPINQDIFERFGAQEIAPVLANATTFPDIERLHRVPIDDETRPLQALGMRGLGSLVGSRELNTMEQLLVHCASALEANDVQSAQQITWVISNIASMDGEPNQKLLACFLRALISRAAKFTPHMLPQPQGPLNCSKITTVMELTNYVDVMPWYRFGYIAANGAILEASRGKDRVHIFDFNTSHCMQWPTLIEAFAERAEGPPHFRLSVCVAQSQVPPLLEVSYEQLLHRLAKFARLKNVPFEFQLLPQDCELLDPSTIDVRDGEVFAVNCLLRLHYVADEGVDPSSCARDKLLRLVRNLNPAVVTLTDEDANLTSPKIVTRLKAAFNYLWIPFDALDALLPRNSDQRVHYEGEIANRIENIIACEGRQRIERVEGKDRWMQRMKKAQFRMIPFSQEVMGELKHMLGEHSGCWRLRKDEDEDVLFLTWKGHNVSFSTAWVPA